jgi:ABC-2 type transport system permease protein
LRVQIRASLQTALTYRVDFIVSSAMALFWITWGLVPMLVVWRGRTIAGWDLDEALLVVAWFTLLRGLLEGAVSPALVAVVERIRKGTLDFVLLKPADAQFLVSTAKFEPVHLVDVFAALGLAVYAFMRLGRWPAPLDVAVALALTIAAAALLYSVAVLVVASAFWVVRVDNLIYLFNSVFDAGRWPSTVWKGALRIIFTFIIPLALMTSWPAMALLGRLSLTTALAAIGGAAAFVLLSRLVWLRAIGHYTSAGG